jgi:hypothetical protein
MLMATGRPSAVARKCSFDPIDFSLADVGLPALGAIAELHGGESGAGALRIAGRRQVEAFARLDAIMSTGNQSPSVRATDIVLDTMRKGRRASS